MVYCRQGQVHGRRRGLFRFISGEGCFSFRVGDMVFPRLLHFGARLLLDFVRMNEELGQVPGSRGICRQCIRCV